MSAVPYLSLATTSIWLLLALSVTNFTGGQGGGSFPESGFRNIELAFVVFPAYVMGALPAFVIWPCCARHFYLRSQLAEGNDSQEKEPPGDVRPEPWSYDTWLLLYLVWASVSLGLLAISLPAFLRSLN